MEREYTNTHYWSLSQSFEVLEVIIWKKINVYMRLSYIGVFKYRLWINMELSIFLKIKQKPLLWCLLELHFSDPQNCPISLSASLNILFLFFLSEIWQLFVEITTSKASAGNNTFFSFIPPWVTEPGYSVDILSVPCYHLKIISHLSSFENPDFVKKLKSPNYPDLSLSHSHYLQHICLSLPFIHGFRFGFTLSSTLL